MGVSLIKPDVLTSAHWDACNLACPALSGQPCPRDTFHTCPEYSSKFSSAAAELLWSWSLDSSQDEDCGDAQLGNGWHALFRSERAVLHTGNSGFVSAWRIEDGADVDAYWAEIEKGARYMDDWDDRDHECADETCGESC